ncbi:GIY-YIG nuclease family protein [Candidatus Saccharibacteria bacterium]|nr:GIY-YIG nuclease family protein [Candidatus Saccharibacteria bacterium]
MMSKQYYVYLLTNKTNQVLYTGVTSDLVRRVNEHKNHLVEGYSDKYNVDKLVYFEVLDDPENAIKREKQIKNWHRDWKLSQIKKSNPNMKDLYEKILK